MGLFSRKSQINIPAKLLVLEIPKNNDKKELAAEQMFAAIHGILRDAKELKLNSGVQEHVSFEIASVKKLIRFYVWVPESLRNFIEGQIYAQYPSVQIHEANEDYAARLVGAETVATADLTLSDDEYLPIKTFQSFEVDPLAGITATLSKLHNSDEEIWIQILARPINDSWHVGAAHVVDSIKGTGGFMGGGTNWAQLATILAKPLDPNEKIEISERDKTRVSEIEKKSTKLGYRVAIRVAYIGPDQTSAKLQIQAVAGAFKQFNSTNLNGFKLSQIRYGADGLQNYRARAFLQNGFILNSEELASVYHLPHTNVETPNVVWASSKVAEPPSALPILNGTDDDKLISAFGITNFRGMDQQFGIRRRDRNRHIYVIGQTGTGKSGLLELLSLSDIFHAEGYAIIDPHGDYAINNLHFIPPHRIKDVIYFNASDTEFPLAFNPMELIDPSFKNNTCSEIIGVLKRMFGDSWGPRLENLLRYTILALLEYPETTMLDITRMLTDKKFREKVLRHVKDIVVLQFWRVEWSGWGEKNQADAIGPVLNKIGAFTANSTIRNIIGQPKSSFNIREIMDAGKILVVNLSKGLIGEDNAGILGSFFVTKIQLAAMSRSDIPNVDDRRPFYLYVDEFQNFATDSFAVILSEARKYGLCLTVANQYISQMSDTVRESVFGNVGTLLSFRVSADDATKISKQFEPQFEPPDIISMNNRHFVVNMIIDGEKTQPFSGVTLALPPRQDSHIDAITEHTRDNYSKPRLVVEQEIAEKIDIPLELHSKTQRRAIRKSERADEEVKYVTLGTPNPVSTPPVSTNKNVSPSGKTGSQTVLPKNIGGLILNKVGSVVGKQQGSPEKKEVQSKRQRSNNRNKAKNGSKPVGPPSQQTKQADTRKTQQPVNKKSKASDPSELQIGH
ncbi:type IV secretion system DNA-binding domain-containing protein [Candidatus Saccharibacteria bacterium]|nr:type IV secretion system DNA-binding domain-containing protein [Candidatus Saccharibacteria bacterium]